MKLLIDESNIFIQISYNSLFVIDLLDDEKAPFLIYKSKNSTITNILEFPEEKLLTFCDRENQLILINTNTLKVFNIIKLFFLKSTENI